MSLFGGWSGSRGSFFGGIHPPEHKQRTAEEPIEVVPTPAEVRISLLQHLGAVCDPLIKPREEVHLGAEIGRSEKFISAPVHASISGTAMRATVATLPNGRHVPVIPIRAYETQPLADRALYDAMLGGSWPLGEAEQFEPGEIVESAREAGLVGMGGAAFPTFVKLMRQADQPVDTVLVNGCECEPFLTADYRMMVEAPQAIVAGGLLVRRALGAQRVLLCIEDNKPLAVRALREQQGPGIEVVVLQTKYPQGGERQLVQAATGRVMPGGGLPMRVGVAVLNISTVAALAAAVYRGRPLTHRVVTVSGGGIRQAKNLLAPVGTSYRELIRLCGGLTPDAARVIAGGPMMGFSFAADDEVADKIPIPITKGTSGLTVLTRREIQQAEQTACLRCGRCVDVCPMRLVPTRLALATRANRVSLLQRYHIGSCVECGCCAYACPASIPLVQLIRVGKIQFQNP